MPQLYIVHILHPICLVTVRNCLMLLTTSLVELAVMLFSRVIVHHVHNHVRRPVPTVDTRVWRCAMPVLSVRQQHARQRSRFTASVAAERNVFSACKVPAFYTP